MNLRESFRGDPTWGPDESFEKEPRHVIIVLWVSHVSFLFVLSGLVVWGRKLEKIKRTFSFDELSCTHSALPKTPRGLDLGEVALCFYLHWSIRNLCHAHGSVLHSIVALTPQMVLPACDMIGLALGKSEWHHGGLSHFVVQRYYLFIHPFRSSHSKDKLPTKIMTAAESL